MLLDARKDHEDRTARLHGMIYSNSWENGRDTGWPPVGQADAVGKGNHQ
jgi:hypothetical protein